MGFPMVNYEITYSQYKIKTTVKLRSKLKCVPIILIRDGSIRKNEAGPTVQSNSKNSLSASTS